MVVVMIFVQTLLRKFNVYIIATSQHWVYHHLQRGDGKEENEREEREKREEREREERERIHHT